MINKIQDFSFYSFIGDDTEIVVCFDYHPYEPMTNYYPGAREEATIHTVLIGNDDIIDNLNTDTLERLKNEAFDFMQSDYIDLKSKITDSGVLLFSRKGNVWFKDPKIALE